MALIAFTLVLLIIVILIKLKVPIPAILGLAAIILMLLCNKEISGIAEVILSSATASETNKLLAIVYLIIFLGKIMERSGSLSRMVSSIEKVFPESGIMAAIMPAIIGLLPMPGGALLSAPIVGELKVIKSERPEIKAAINYWFRHGWEFAWPLYPGIIMASALSGVSIGTIITYQLPMAVAFFLVGLIRFRKNIGSIKKNNLTFRENFYSLSRFFSSISPIILVVFLNFVLGLDILISLGIIIIFTITISAKKLSPLHSFLRSSITFGTFWLIEAIMLLKNAVESSGLAIELTTLFSSSNILAHALTSVVAFAIGLISGMTTAFVGIAFTLLPSTAGVDSNYATGFLTYTCGFVGVMLSPTHLCLLLSREYFGAELGQVYRAILIPIIIILLVGIVIFSTIYN